MGLERQTKQTATIERKLDLIKKSKMLNANKQHLFKFSKFCFADGLTSKRIDKLLHVLSKVAIWLKKDFNSASKDDIIDVVQKIEAIDYADWTKHDYKVVIKKFYKWLKGTEDHYPNEVRWIKTRIGKSNHILPEELLTEDEVKRMVEAAGNIRDKALIFVLYESGCRIGEIANLKLKHIEFEKHGVRLIVSGKTGDRRIILISSTSLLANWINNHPFRNDPETFVWIGIGTRNNKKGVSYNALSEVIKKAARRANIKKRVHPHLLRHSRASFLANHLTDSQMNAVFGWAQGSDMPGTYVHLSGRDVDKALLKASGVKLDEDEKEESKLKPKTCPRCKQTNPVIALFCDKCTCPLDIKTSITIEEKRNTADHVMEELMNDPEVVKFLVNKLQDSKLGDKLVKLAS